MKKLWFASKRYGYGWTPSTWQGWLCIAVYVVLMIVTPVITEKFSQSEIEALLIAFPFWFFFTVLLIIIAWKTGEPARWRWGK